jgi:hypothetical protein
MEVIRMLIRSHRFGATLLALAGILAVAGCTQEQSQASAEADLCGSLSAFGDSLQALEDLDPATASADDVQAAREDIDAAWEDVAAAAQDVSEADEAALETAWSELSSEIQDIPTDQPIADVLADLQSTAGEVRGVYQEMADGSGCA